MKRSFATGINSNAVNRWLLLARLIVGILMMTHGVPKLMKLLDGNTQFADPFGIGPGASLALTVFAEAICAFLIVIGLATRWAAVPLIITMLVIIFIIHAEDPFGKKELPIIYLVFFIGFFILGPGRYSLDHLIKKNKIRYLTK